MSAVGTAWGIEGARGAAATAEDEGAGPSSAVARRTVLVALPDHAPPEGLIEMARVVAGALQAPLHGVLVGSLPCDARDVPEHLGLDPEALQGIVLEVACRAPGAAADPGDVLAAALARRPTAYVIVPAEPEDAAGGRLGLGALAWRALQAATSGVVVVGAVPVAPHIRRVLLPLDGTPSTAAAITPVGELARNAGAELVILHVGGAAPGVAPPPPAEHGAMAPPQYVDQPQHEWPAFSEEFLHRFLGAIGHCPADVETRFFVSAGEPAAEILRMAGELESDLLALVWHGELGHEHASVFRRVLQGAPCPVLVLRR